MMLWSACLYGQTSARRELPSASTFEVHARKVNDAVKIDGSLDEDIWKTASPISHFQYAFPVDTGFSNWQTEIRICFDEKYLYVGGTCWQKREDYIVQSLKRDFPPGTSDVLNIVLDPTKDGLNGFVFSVSPLNVQREALIDNGANMSFEWDNKWYSAVKNYDDRWTIEMAIPFKTLRYTVAPGENTWHVNFVRTKLKNWEISTWRPVPQQYSPNNVAFAGNLVWDQPPPPTGSNIVLLPYLTSGYSLGYNRDANTQQVLSRDGKLAAHLGGDAKIAITPALNLDLTVNPDFSQVEVDRQVANLSRFELFFPERRQFFLENRDLFAMFGFPGTRPFFSRQIGLADTSANHSQQYATVPILAGARLSGKINDNWRIGLLNMQTKSLALSGNRVIPAANFTVATLQRKVFKRSTLGAIYVDKENFLSKLTASQKAGYLPWNRVAGLEYNLYSHDNRWEGEWYYHRSFSSDPHQRGATFAHYLGYTDRHFTARTGYMRVDSTYSADVGFVPRTGIQSMFPGIGWLFYPKHQSINTWGLNIDGNLTYNLGFRETDHDWYYSAHVDFKNLASFTVGYFHTYTFLTSDFDPTNLYRENTQPLPANHGYTYAGFRGTYASSTTYNLQGFANLTVGQFFNGHIVSTDGEISYRIQPFGTLALGYSYNRIRLPQPYASADFWLLGPRAELSFSRKLFGSAFFQYNTQANNFNINTRLQWRFAPVSDMFLVFTDNSFAQPLDHTSVRFLSPKNKALVLKIVYWLNV
jgi:hypothetical protein